MNFNNFTIKSQEVVQQAVQTAQQNGNQAIEPEHLLKALLDKGESVVKFVFQKLGVNQQLVAMQLDKALSALPKVSGGEPYLSRESNDVLLKAIDCAKRLGSLVAAHVMGRPADDTADFVLSLADAGRLPFGEPGCGAGAAEKKPALPSGEPADEQLLAAIEDTPGGIGVQTLARLLDAPVDRVRERLEALASLGLVVRRRGAGGQPVGRVP